MLAEAVRDGTLKGLGSGSQTIVIGSFHPGTVLCGFDAIQVRIAP